MEDIFAGYYAKYYGCEGIAAGKKEKWRCRERMKDGKEKGENCIKRGIG